MNKIIYTIIIFSLCFGQWEFQDSKLKSMKRGGLNHAARGCIIGDCFNGSGTFKYKDGTQYMGYFKNGLKHGYGIFIFNDQNRYIGEWEKDIKWGFGKYLFHTGQYYIGEYKRDERRGLGMLVFANKLEKYIGEFRRGEKDGWGIKHTIIPTENALIPYGDPLTMSFTKNDTVHLIEAGAFNKEDKLFSEPIDSVIIRLHQKYSDRGIILQYLAKYNEDLVQNLFNSENITMECGVLYGTNLQCPYNWDCIDGLCDNNATNTISQCISEIYDCLGVCDGSAIEDECGVCNGNGPKTNFDCDDNCLVDLDCAGECGGDAVVDGCGKCNGDGPQENFDCDGNCLLEIDCEGVCGGNAIIDKCGECNGDGIAKNACDCDGNVLDCSGECGGDAIIDECGVCNGPGLIICENNKQVCNINECEERGCDLPMNSIKLINNQIIYNTNMPIYGFEIHIQDAMITYIGGGEAENHQFTNAVMGSIIIGQSFAAKPMTSNCGKLIDIDITNNKNKIISASIKNAYGIPQPLNIVNNN